MAGWPGKCGLEPTDVCVRCPWSSAVPRGTRSMASGTLSKARAWYPQTPTHPITPARQGEQQGPKPTSPRTKPGPRPCLLPHPLPAITVGLDPVGGHTAVPTTGLVLPAQDSVMALAEGPTEGSSSSCRPRGGDSWRPGRPPQSSAGQPGGEEARLQAQPPRWLAHLHWS